MNNQFRKKEIIYDVFRESDLEQTIACITEVFPKREPMTRALRFTSEELYLFSEIYCKKAAKEGLSIVAKDRTTSKVIGFCISEDLASEPIEGIKKINVKSNPIMALLTRLDEEYKKAHKVEKGHIFHLNTVGVSEPYENQNIATTLLDKSLIVIR